MACYPNAKVDRQSPYGLQRTIASLTIPLVEPKDAPFV